MCLGSPRLDILPGTESEPRPAPASAILGSWNMAILGSWNMGWSFFPTTAAIQSYARATKVCGHLAFETSIGYTRASRTRTVALVPIFVNGTTSCTCSVVLVDHEWGYYGSIHRI